MTKFYKYISESKKASSTMIGFEINKSSILSTILYIKNKLDEWNILYEEIENNHITLAMIDDVVKKDEIVRDIHEITKNFSFSFKQFEILPGRDKWDFIVVQMKRSDEYSKLREKFKEKYVVKQFNEPMKPHISLFRIEKNKIKENEKSELFKDCPKPKKTTANKVQLWNSKFQIDYVKKSKGKEKRKK